MRKYRILFVDDEANILSSIQRLFFDNEDFEVFTALGGREGLELLEKQGVDIIVSDQRMPQMSGNEFLSTVKEKYPDPLRMVLTGYADIDAAIVAINKGEVYRYLTKPWDDEDLKITLYKTMEYLRLRNENREMNELIIKQNKELKDLNIKLEEKVKERTRELVKAKEELEIKNKELIEELEVARGVQHAILPHVMPKFQNLSFKTLLISMGAVSGDYYDIFHIDENHIGIVISDVSGHGVPSALVTTMAKISFSSHSKFGNSTADICSNVNRDLFSAIGDVEFYLSAFYIIVNTKTLEFEYTNAGHQKAIHYSYKRDAILNISTDGCIIGAIKDPVYGVDSDEMKPGDKLILYTDGITEVRNEKDLFFGLERLCNCIRNNRENPSEILIENLIEKLNTFGGNSPQDDDRTIIVIEAKK